MCERYQSKVSPRDPSLRANDRFSKKFNFFKAFHSPMETYLSRVGLPAPAHRQARSGPVGRVQTHTGSHPRFSEVLPK